MKPKTLADLVRGFQKIKTTAFVQKTDFRTFRYSYDDVYKMACKVANLLDDKGVKKGDKVMIWGQSSVAWGFAFLGCILKGAIAIPLDIRSQPELIKTIQRQVNAKVFFRTKFKEDPGIRIRTVFLEDLEYEIESMSDDGPSEKIQEEGLVEILYTSGTTGIPKGVLLTHKNILSNVLAIQTLAEVSEKDTFLTVLPMSHIFEQTAGFFYPLSKKASICFISSIKPSAIFKALSRERITMIALVPRFLEMFRKGIYSQAREKGVESMLRMMIALGSNLPRPMRKRLLGSIHSRFGYGFRYFIVGGAPLDPELEQFWEKIGFTLLQGYGLTETSPIISCNSPQGKKIGSVGKILEGVNVILRDNEIWVKGDGVTQGYYKNPEKNKESFEQGWFKTGDLGHIDEDGFLFLKGRKKDMIKTSGGINVYPDDIEMALNKIQGVKEACVVGFHHGAVEKVHAMLILEESTKRDPKQIIAEANGKLDTAQQIQEFTIWPFDDFPRTATMKVRKFQVLEYLQTSAEGKKARPPRGIPRVEEKIYSILKALAHDHAEIKPESKLGADLKLGSIDRVELVSLIEQEMNLDIDENEITQTTTVRELERMVEERKSVQPKRLYRRWTLSWPIGAARNVMQTLLIFPVVRLFCSPMEVKGIENLQDMKGPVIIVANHQSHFDVPSILMNLPVHMRNRVCPAAWEEYFEAPGAGLLYKIWLWIAYNFTTIFLNTYAFPQTKGFKRSIQYTGELLDKGWNILVFPEGSRSSKDKLLPFMDGIGLIATETRVPIVPIRLHGLHAILPREKTLPRRGKVRIIFGKPMVFKKESSVEIVKKLERAVRDLG